jgi:hypothetical protein
MSVRDQKTQIGELTKLTKDVGGKLARARKVLQMHQFLEQRSVFLRDNKLKSVYYNINSAINSVSKTKINSLEKSPEAIAESFWSLIERRMLGIDGEGLDVGKKNRGTAWLGAWARKNGIDDLKIMGDFTDANGFDFDAVTTIGAILNGVPMTDEIGPLLEKLVKATCMIDRQLRLIEQEDVGEDTSGEESEEEEVKKKGKLAEEDDGEKDDDSEKVDEAEQDDGDEDSAALIECKEADAEKKTEAEEVYEKLFEVHGTVCQSFFEEVLKDPIFEIDVAELMKKQRLQAKAAASEAKKRKAAENPDGEPGKEARKESEDEEEEEDEDEEGEITDE